MLLLTIPYMKSCRDAKKYLDNYGFEYDERNMIENPLTEDELAEIFSHAFHDIDDFFNDNGKLFDVLVDQQNLVYRDLQDKLIMLSNDPYLLKRPILLDGDLVILGFDEKEYRRKLKK